MTIYVDNPQLLEIRRGKSKAISFSVIFELAPGTFIVTKGYRVMGGLITPPHVPTSRTGRYVPISYLSYDLASSIYRTVQGAGWAEWADPLVEPLLDQETATTPLVPTLVEISYVAPVWVKQMKREAGV